MEPQKSSNNSTLLIVIIVIIVGIIILGVGGYFGWKYYKAKFVTNAVTKSSPTPTATLTSAKVSPTATATPTPMPTPTATLSTSKSILGDYVITDSNTRVIQEGELIGLTPWQLKVARNEIYARHGRPFVHKDLQCYFATKSWYQEIANFSESDLSTVENKNVATIQTYEQKINSPLQSQDTGC